MKGIKPYKGPKPQVGTQLHPKKFARGMDPVTATKKFFLYKDIFGDMGGPPGGMPKMMGSGLGSGMKPSKDGPSGGTGNIRLITSARRMGII